MLSQRGVHPDLLIRYKKASSSFACLDGSKSVPSTYLNDNFCDCADGSDEPGGRGALGSYIG
jgi:protein kinase C substrate 80K-H